MHKRCYDGLLKDAISNNTTFRGCKKDDIYVEAKKRVENWFHFQIVISFYEVILNLLYEDAAFQPWAKHLIVINSLLCTINSSCNFAFYCGDVVFRQCLSTISIEKLAKVDFLAKLCNNRRNDQRKSIDEIPLQLKNEDRASMKTRQKKKVRVWLFVIGIAYQDKKT